MKTSISLCLCLLVSLTLRAAELSTDEAAGILKQLQKIRETEPAAQADFHEEKVTHLLNKPLVSEGTVIFEAPGKFRREVKGDKSSLSVSDGKTMWVYYANFKEAEHYSIGQRSVLDDSLAALTAGLNFEHIEEYYDFKAFREEDGYQFQLTPKQSKLKRLLERVVIWLDKDFKVQKAELYMQKGDRQITTFKNVRRMGALPASTFEFTPPADAHVSYPLGK